MRKPEISQESKDMRNGGKHFSILPPPEKKKAKVVIAPQLARFLLKRGYQIIDIKPDRKNQQDSVFVFKVEDGFDEAIREFLSNKKSKGRI